MQELIKRFQRIDYKSKEDIISLLQVASDDLAVEEGMLETVASDYMLACYTGMTTDDAIDSLTLVSVQNMQDDPVFEDLAVRFLLLKTYFGAFGEQVDNDDFDQMYREDFVRYVEWGIEEGLISPNLAKKFNLYELAIALKPSRDLDFTYIGLHTARNRYSIKHRGTSTPREVPQYMWMRVAMGMAQLESDATLWAKKFYEKLSKKEYTAGGSTMVAAGTNEPSLANCFLLDTDDTIEHIFDNIANVAKISKATGGIGISVTKLRSEGSPIKSNNTFSSGPIPFVNVMDATLAAIARAGKKKGAMAIYMENWHINFPDFLDLKQNSGDDYRRTRIANTAVYISDEFMKRVANNENWYLFDP